MTNPLTTETCDIAIIGGGPTGLAAATILKERGFANVIVLDRETDAGGIPRHCGHPPFGLVEFKNLLTGPTYAKKLVERAINAGVQIRTRSTVSKLGKSGVLTIISPERQYELQAKRVLLAMGTRETPRSMKLISGKRPLGIYNTGALQSMVYLKGLIPFKQPVIVGSEIVSFSALFTCKKAGIKPVAMVEEKTNESIMWPISLCSYLVGVPLFWRSEIISIQGNERVESVTVTNHKNKKTTIPCDGVLFTGGFLPESSIVRQSHLDTDTSTGEPLVDVEGRCSDNCYYAAGNVLFKPVKVAGKCWKAGSLIARTIEKDLLATIA